MTLREEKPPADSCDDPYPEKQIEGLLPVGCGAEAVFNFSWEKQIFPYGSGDDDETAGTTVLPSQTLFSAAIHHRTTRETKSTGVGDVSVATPNRLSPRIPTRFTPSPEIRHSSFQHLLRMHLNTFNLRLSMLESNTLDMKDSIHRMEDQQLQLSSDLKELIAIQSVGEKSKKVGELEKGYTDMDGRLSRLEGRLEILIDGFTALAQEMNKMKRARHVSRSIPEKRDPPLPATLLPLSLYPTHGVKPTETPFTSRATVPKSIPTPGLPADQPNTARQRVRKLKSAGKASTRTTLSRPRTTSKSASKSKTTVKPKAKFTAGRRSAGTAKHVSSRAKPKQLQRAITTFQLEPPSHKAKPDQAKRKDSPPIRRNGQNKAFRSDAPVPKKVQERGKSPEGESKRSHKGGGKTEDNSYKLVSQNTRKKTVSTTKPTSTKKKSNATVKRTTPSKTKTTPGKKKSNATVKRKPTAPKAKAATAKRVTNKAEQKRKKTKYQPGVLDLLQLLQGHHKSGKKGRSQDGSLHVVLGRLAIPIRIIPDD